MVRDLSAVSINDPSSHHSALEVQINEAVVLCELLRGVGVRGEGQRERGRQGKEDTEEGKHEPWR